MHSRNPKFEPGNMWVVCDVCGFDYRRNKTRIRWDGLVVCEKDWEPRHPQDFARGVKDTIAPEGPSRPPPTEVFEPDADNEPTINVVGTHGGSIT
jgi:hypothetical protein